MRRIFYSFVCELLWEVMMRERLGSIPEELKSQILQELKVRRGAESYRFKSEVQLTTTVTGNETASDLSELIRNVRVVSLGLSPP
jgi:hypothetical protein